MSQVSSPLSKRIMRYLTTVTACKSSGAAVDRSNWKPAMERGTSFKMCKLSLIWTWFLHVPVCYTGPRQQENRRPPEPPQISTPGSEYCSPLCTVQMPLFRRFLAPEKNQRSVQPMQRLRRETTKEEPKSEAISCPCSCSTSAVRPYRMCRQNSQH